MTLFYRYRNGSGNVWQMMKSQCVSSAGLEKACEEALKQIREKRYDERLRNDGRTDVLTYGIAEQEIFPSCRIGAVALPLQIGYNMNSVATVYRYGVRRGFLSLSVVFLKIKVF